MNKNRVALNAAIKILTSIACEPYKDMTKESYWLGVPHKRCAELLAGDTKLARIALRGIAKIMKLKGEK